MFGFNIFELCNCFDNDVICYYWALKLAYFVEHNVSYQPSKCQSSKMSGSKFTQGDRALSGQKAQRFYG